METNKLQNKSLFQTEGHILGFAVRAPNLNGPEYFGFFWTCKAIFSKVLVESFYTTNEKHCVSTERDAASYHPTASTKSHSVLADWHAFNGHSWRILFWQMLQRENTPNYSIWRKTILQIHFKQTFNDSIIYHFFFRYQVTIESGGAKLTDLHTFEWNKPKDRCDYFTYIFKIWKKV